MHDIPKPTNFATREETPEQRALRLVRGAERLGDTVYRLPVSPALFERSGLPPVDLPSAIGFDGGAARNILEALVHNCRLNRAPRDIDLIRFEDEPYDEAAQYRVFEALSEGGVGAEMHCDTVSMDRIEQYMATRDLALNQLLFQPDGKGGGSLYCTAQAIHDMASMTVRPSVYQQCDREINGKTVHMTPERIALKVLRLVAEYQADGVQATVGGIDFRRGIDYDYRAVFQEIVSLNKILERGVEATRRYMSLLNRYGLTTEHNPERLFASLEGEVWDFSLSPLAEETLRAYGSPPPPMTEQVGRSLGASAARIRFSA